VTLNLLSPAKVNLFFRVLNKRSDGYHEIASLYQAIDLFDAISISFSTNDEVICDHTDVPSDRSNLAFKAISLFKKHQNIDKCFRISIKKHIPTQSGLGGGSSNLATALYGLNKLTASNLSLETLAQIAAIESSDAPFFLSSGTAYCTSKGEKFEDVNPIPMEPFWIAKPKVSLSTPKVYAQLNKTNFIGENPIDLLRGWKQNKITLVNNLEAAAFNLLPQLIDLKHSLLSLGFSHVAMTGSGSAFICFGMLQKPYLPHVQFFSVTPIQRDKFSWFKKKP